MHRCGVGGAAARRAASEDAKCPFVAKFAEPHREEQNEWLKE
jgi:hypothetical protein